MRSSREQFLVNVIKRVNLGHIPLFVQLAHKGLDKSIPEVKIDAGDTVFNVSKDILSLSISDAAVLEPIESIEFVYRKS